MADKPALFDDPLDGFLVVGGAVVEACVVDGLVVDTAVVGGLVVDADTGGCRVVAAWAGLVVSTTVVVVAAQVVIGRLVVAGSQVVVAPDRAVERSSTSMATGATVGRGLEAVALVVVAEELAEVDVVVMLDEVEMEVDLTVEDGVDAAVIVVVAPARPAACGRTFASASSVSGVASAGLVEVPGADDGVDDDGSDDVRVVGVEVGAVTASAVGAGGCTAPRALSGSTFGSTSG